MADQNHEGWFYAVHIPGGNAPDDGSGDSAAVSEESRGKVFTSEIDALKFLKENKKAARFKRFASREAAEKFVKKAFTPPTPQRPGGRGDFLCPSPDKPAAEEGCSFPSVSWPQLTKLKRAIEAGECETVTNLIDENPRYLISVSSDTPTVVHAGCRYNPLHVAAMQGQYEICQMVLERVSDPDYLSRLYPDSDDAENSEKRRRFLVEGYLNTPDKSSNQSPLHFASSFGYLDIVRLLTSYPECSLSPRSKKGKTPSELACTQIANGNVKANNAQEIARIRDEIQLICSDSCAYVSLYRPRGYSGAPVLRSPRFERPENVLVSPIRKDIAMPSDTDPNASSPAAKVGLVLAAVAGPMNPKKAEEFYAKWKATGITTPTSGKASHGPASYRRSDIHKGMERIGRSVAKELDCPWTEFWPFLQTFADLSQPDGMRLLEDYLRDRENGTAPPTGSFVGTGVLRSLMEVDESNVTSPFASPLESKRTRSVRKVLAEQENSYERGTPLKRPIPTRLNFGFVDDEDKTSSISRNSCETQSSEEDFQDAVVEHVEEGEGERSEVSLLADMLSGFHIISPEGNQRKSLKVSIPNCDGSSDGDVSSEKQASTDNSDFITPPSTPPAIYIGGDKPTKMDLDVFLAIEEHLKEMGEKSALGPLGEFPYVSRWANVMRVYSPTERAEWPGLDSPRARRTSSTTSTPGPAARINFSAYLPEKFSSRTYPPSPLSSITRQ